MNADPDLACEAIGLGALGYLLKDSGGEDFLRAVHCVVQGISYVSPRVAQAMEERFILDPKFPTAPRRLSSRQREVLQMLAEGRSMKEIAYILQISCRTVRFHKYRIMEELGIKTNSGLVQYAMKNAIIFPQ